MPLTAGRHVDLVAPIEAFLSVRTPDAWAAAACDNLDELLIDHANCELKAASSALALLYRYPEREQLCDRMSRLAREELRHFEQVRKHMRERGVRFRRLPASRYAGALNRCIRSAEPGRLLDALLVGAIIEARSCERFACLAPLLPVDLGNFYRGLLASEARHFENYLALARRETRASQSEIDDRLAELLEQENELVVAADSDLRFHSGPPA